MRLLAASDIHLGRIPALPGPRAGLTGRSAWEEVVQCALTQKVDALLLAGDVVESDNAYFQAFGPLRKGLERLKESGIKVIAVAGNHDAKAFPALAGACDAVTMLGLGGQWQACALGPLQILGWSFPQASFRGNPLDSFREAELAEGRPYLGLLHCDLDGSAGSQYAPVPGRALEATRAATWVLGHVHKGELRARDRAFYCGSPFALDAGEEGQHGVWLLEVDDQGQLRRQEQVPLSPWTFQTLSVSLDQISSFEDARDRIASALERAALAGAAQAGTAVYCSFRFYGDCALSGSLRKRFQEVLPDLELCLAGVTVRPTGRIQDDTAPILALDLAAMAGKRGIRGSLARVLLQAQDPESPLDELQGLLAELLPILPEAGAGPEQARAILCTAARRLLVAIERQHGEV